ncbi:MAG TPA: GNAT family N-acetyltransferase [Actinomycetes bacterium]|jgi:GNAT superfamily N-acetyltransferase|nr:GNAT family N-acetyltransferase [Actinomycetes bacterium]
MKSNAIIRKASKTDTGAIARIYLTAARAAVEREPGHFRIPTVDEASRLFVPQDSPDAAVLVAEVDGRVAGFVEVLLRRAPEQPSMIKPRLLGYVRELGVSEDARGGGIGSQLMEAAEEWARLAGAQAMMVDTGAKNSQAQRFYRERMGYRDIGVIPLKPLC